MRLSTVFISSTFVLSGMSAAFPVETEDMLIARFTDSDFLSEVEARAYDEEPELYVRHRGVISTNNYKTLSRHRRSFYEPGGYESAHRTSRDDLPTNDQPKVTFSPDTKGPPLRPSESLRPPTPMGGSPSGCCNSISNMFNRNRRSFDELLRSELTRRLLDPPVPDGPPNAPNPPRRVTWSPDTVDTPDRPRLSPRPSRPRTPQK